MKLKWLKHSIINREVSVIIAVLIIAHLLMYIIYLVYMPYINSLFRKNIAQDIINVIRLTSVTPLDSRKKALTSLVNLRADISKKPKWLWQINGSDYDAFASMQQFADQIIQFASKESNYLQLSYKLNKGDWLNITANLYHYSHITLWIFVIELLNLYIIITYLWIIHRFRKPLRNFKKFAEDMKLDFKINMLPSIGPKIIREVTETVNKMQYRIREVLDQRKLTLSALSHDLRTPITRLRLRAQFIEDKLEQQKTIADLNEMEQMLDDSIMFIKQNYFTGKKKNKIDLISLIKSLCDEFADMGYKVLLNSDFNRLGFLAEPTILKRAFANVIHNAIKYGKTATINITQKNQDIVITIDDDGPGLTDIEKDKIFEPFYRIETSRSKDTGGTGLGLAIAKSIINDHNGEIEAANLARGLRIMIRFSQN